MTSPCDEPSYSLSVGPLQAACRSLGEHDATLPFPPALLDPADVPELIVSNPPWGKNFGAHDDGLRIVRNLIGQFAGFW